MFHMDYILSVSQQQAILGCMNIQGSQQLSAAPTEFGLTSYRMAFGIQVFALEELQVCSQV